MTVNSYLFDLASDLVLSKNEKENVITSLNTIKTRISSYFSDVSEEFSFGSYTRDTILPKKSDENSDIDLMIVFNNQNEYKPQTFLTKLKNFAECYYSRSEIYQSYPSVVLELNHIKFDLVPAKKKYSTYFIPNKNIEWMTTDPNGFNSTLIECNKNNNSKIKPTIRLLKHWNIYKNDRDMASFDLEQKIANEMTYSYYSCTSYTDYVKKAFDIIKYDTVLSRVDTAIKYIDDALSDEGNRCPLSALRKIKKIFPEM